MPTLVFRRWWIGAGYLLVAATVVNSLLPWPAVPGGPEHADKVMHALAFLVLTVWFAGLHDRSRHPLIALLFIGFGGAIELAQGQTGYREADLMDFLADVAGVALGVLISRTGLGDWCVYVESRLTGRDHV